MFDEFEYKPSSSESSEEEEEGEEEDEGEEEEEESVEGDWEANKQETTSSSRRSGVGGGGGGVKLKMPTVSVARLPRTYPLYREAVREFYERVCDPEERLWRREVWTPDLDHWTTLQPR